MEADMPGGTRWVRGCGRCKLLPGPQAWHRLCSRAAHWPPEKQCCSLLHLAASAPLLLQDMAATVAPFISDTVHQINEW